MTTNTPGVDFQPSAIQIDRFFVTVFLIVSIIHIPRPTMTTTSYIETKPLRSAAAPPRPPSPAPQPPPRALTAVADATASPPGRCCPLPRPRRRPPSHDGHRIVRRTATATPPPARCANCDGHLRRHPSAQDNKERYYLVCMLSCSIDYLFLCLLTNCF